MTARSSFGAAALREQASVEALAAEHGAGAKATTKSAAGKLSRAADARWNDVSPLSGLGRICDGLGQTKAQSPIGDRLTPSGANRRAEVTSPTLVASLSINLSETTHEQAPTRGARGPAELPRRRRALRMLVSWLRHHPRRSFDAHVRHCEAALALPGAAP